MQQKETSGQSAEDSGSANSTENIIQGIELGE